MAGCSRGVPGDRLLQHDVWVGVARWSWGAMGLTATVTLADANLHPQTGIRRIADHTFSRGLGR